MVSLCSRRTGISKGNDMTKPYIQKKDLQGQDVLNHGNKIEKYWKSTQ
jgi:hypothetical protein